MLNFIGPKVLPFELGLHCLLAVDQKILFKSYDLDHKLNVSFDPK